MSLREELERIAASAPTADVPSDTWARAQRTNRRARALTVAAAAAVVALLATMMVWLPDLALQPADGDADPGVPDHIWAVPEHMGARDDDGSWSRDEVSTDLAVGQAAAAYVTLKGLAVVIDAVDGDYHLLDLPGATKSLRLALSPDGSQLAYGYSGSRLAGVRVVRLADGEVRDVPVPARVVGAVAWSSDGQWLAWSGPQGSGAAAGRVGPGATKSSALEVPKGAGLHALTISSGGTVVAVDRTQVLRWEATESRRSVLSAAPGRDLGGAALDPSSGVAGIGTCCDRDAIFVDPASGEVTRVAVSVEHSSVRPLGWLDDGTSAWQVAEEDAGRLVLVSPSGEGRTVAELEDGVPDNLSVAFALLSAERPTVVQAEPRWPWSSQRIFVTVALSVTGTILALAAVWWWRQRSLSSSPRR